MESVEMIFKRKIKKISFHYKILFLEITVDFLINTDTLEFHMWRRSAMTLNCV